ncbi:DNA-protecting protein DprA [Microbulbifer flavimaris]|uniref:DNA-protecting protein DprA n=1 Tax=Microbulbifer flavimaris TaxID=1781068 RepID=A0ABX4HYP3_9GAMM|nr:MULTISPECIES: DNA-processing protein DprA [Microbulbifer]KUJ83076.1 DNA processing protein DprA [Microbulbifer sp. ZGT114]PCO05262.1 DNA-protecting protein DprA [Microbulbifer flavimaris]
MDALTATLALMRLEGMGPGRYWQLLQHFPSAVEALEHLPQTLLQKLPERAQAQWREWQQCGEESALVQWARHERARCADLGVTLLCAGGEDYPPLLAEISRPPPLLYVRGHVNALRLPQIAVVGARRATSAGLDNARAFSRELAAAGFAITSGLALGVDAAAHRGALEAGGVTIAVLGTGIDRLYPRRNAALAEEVLAHGGALVSEFPLGTGAEAANFPRRNRVISGLSLGVLLVEAALRSGSLITARLAAEQNREVFAIPGSIHNPLSRGCHRVIRDGAALVETAADIVSELGGLLNDLPASSDGGSHQDAGPTQRLGDAERRLIGALGGDPRTLEQLARDTGLEAGTLMAQLLQLELAGMVETLPGGYQLTGEGARLLETLA